MKRSVLLLIAALTLVGCNDSRLPVTPAPISGNSLQKVALEPMTWAAQAPDGTEFTGYPNEKKDKFVGVFYFVWHGCHGYDTPANANEVMPPTARDVSSPYNNEELYSADPSQPKFGGFGVMHHWGEPYLGYYVSNDRWVIRKHAQMLAEAGVDVIFLDATNGFHYIPVVKVLCSVFAEVRLSGGKTPQIAFVLNSSAANTLNSINTQFYAQGLYRDLWFMWDGKPLVLADPSGMPTNLANRFTFRHSWFLYNNAGVDTWFGDGNDKWPWGCWYPQQPGLHNGANEFACVMSATHPVNNIGRSFNVDTDSEPAVKTPEKAPYFKAQMNRALELDPQMMFFTGWNEWTAQRQRPQAGVSMLGQPSTGFGCFFVDQFNHEYSRDIEPVRGDFGDTYYYMMADCIRKFKGVPAAHVFSSKNTISVDGDCSDWQTVEASYADYAGDTATRNHYGWGRIGQLVNTTGRNDIVLCKVATDGGNLFFYVQCDKELNVKDRTNWMRLYVSTGNTLDPDWEGFNYRINGAESGDGSTSVEKNASGFKWNQTSTAKIAFSGKVLEISVPLSDLGITNPDDFRIEFKWIDNAAALGDIQTCLTDGDSAPDGRYRYVYRFKTGGGR